MVDLMQESSWEVSISLLVVISATIPSLINFPKLRLDSSISDILNYSNVRELR